ncbi:hypothetical protein EK21DRAFT_93327 [Setomelanomma holmii]|uniref:Uncharacterized protein n=1 Tax=Setomelanomma holmii TaxID=210430 RepID=A0A9P4H1K1_9PLEO|nr:hypothetical protein EK21DRAFT_93327 [Setomelanomma holmii]
MEGGLPLGYTQRGQKRRHSPHRPVGVDRPVSPAWHFPNNNFFNAAVNAPSGTSDRDNRTSFYRDRPTWMPQSRIERPVSPRAEHPYTSGLHPPRADNMEQPQRHEGDGFDYRRPAGFHYTPLQLSEEEDDDMHIDPSQDDEEDVIDLTADDSGYGASQDENSGDRQGRSDANGRNERRERPRPRLPQGMDIIINLDNGEETWRRATPPPEPGSPEIEFISSRTIDPPQRPTRPFGYTADGDEVEFVGSNPLPEEEVQRRRDEEMRRAMDVIRRVEFNGRGPFTHLQAQIQRTLVRVNRIDPNQQRPPSVPPRGARRARGTIRAGFAAPLMEYEMVGFDLGFGFEPPRRAEPPAPTYSAPDNAPEGFTRSPQEDGNLICPNCEEELCVGDDEVKRQVWIVKSCGHVYCGECTTNRSAKRSSKGKERSPRTKPFKECVVEDCGKKVTNPKHMFQIFL